MNFLCIFPLLHNRRFIQIERYISIRSLITNLPMQIAKNRKITEYKQYIIALATTSNQIIFFQNYKGNYWERKKQTNSECVCVCQKMVIASIQKFYLSSSANKINEGGKEVWDDICCGPLLASSKLF